jgi:ADP-heptose:LPS heptosyltransferase
MKEIVAVRFSSLGDVAMLVPVFLSFHQSYPDYQIRLITRARFAPIFSNLDFVRIEVIDPGQTKISLVKLIYFAIQLSRTRPIFILDLHDVLRTKVLRLICRLYGSQISIIDKGRSEKEALINPSGDKSKWLKTTFQRYADVFNTVGFSFELQPIFLKKSLEKEDKLRVGISPFAQHSSKEYSFYKMNELLSKLALLNNIEFYILGKGNREKNLAEDIAGGIPNVQNLIGKMKFEEELKLISTFDLMISMDSGNGHLAANYGIPVLTLWGTTHPKLGFGPYGQPLSNSVFPDAKTYPNLPVSVFGKCDDQNYIRAIDSINVDDIFNKVKEILCLN